MLLWTKIDLKSPTLLLITICIIYFTIGEIFFIQFISNKFVSNYSWHYFSPWFRPRKINFRHLSRRLATLHVSFYPPTHLGFLSHFCAKCQNINQLTFRKKFRGKLSKQIYRCHKRGALPCSPGMVVHCYLCGERGSFVRHAEWYICGILNHSVGRRCLSFSILLPECCGLSNYGVI